MSIPSQPVDAADRLLWSRVATWVDSRHGGSSKLTAAALSAWAKAKGLT